MRSTLTIGPNFHDHLLLYKMFKLGQCVEQNWRKLRGFGYLAKVIIGVTIKDGIETTKPSQIVA